MAVKPLKRERQETINCHYPDISWNSRCLLLWSSHTNFSLFSTDFQLSTRMLIFRKQTRKQENFSVFSSLNTSIFFTTYLKIASTLRPFERLDSKSQFPKWKSLQTFFHNGEQTFYPTVKGKKDNLIRNLFKPFKDTISKTNTCFRQHHDLEPKQLKKSW